MTGTAGGDAPLVSIVTPSLNQGRYINEAIESVVAQEYPNIEHIVIDGGSTDGTLELLRSRDDIQWISEPDGGQADALNKGFRLARGTIFAWLNADDYYLPGAVSAAVAALKETGSDLVHGGWRQVDADGKLIRDVPPVPFDYGRQLEIANRVCQPGAFFTRHAFEAVGGVDASYRYAMDYELWLKLGKRFGVTHVERIQAAYRYHDSSKTVAESAGFVAETWRAGRAHGARRLTSRIYRDYYLPRERPNAYRVLLALRLFRSGNLRSVAGRAKKRLPREG